MWEKKERSILSDGKKHDLSKTSKLWQRSKMKSEQLISILNCDIFTKATIFRNQ